ncbi:hypothetical protein KJ707_03620 [Patescibacteria group bacterium]|nr:hypothetical protein [Patescibacteria group bacterium]MBU1966772.1 hypothetical protein [Patescibacteria group bacterium]MBU2543621.1 hypothetical protein [Patescibacteria group bacterium]
MTENLGNREPGPSSLKGFLRVMRDTLFKPQVEATQKGAKWVAKESVGFVKETLITSGEAFAASGRVLTKDIQEFADSLGIHLFEQGSAPKHERIAGVVVSLTMASFLSLLYLPIASGVLHGPAAGSPEAYAVASLLTLPTSLPLVEAYRYAMGRKRF